MADVPQQERQRRGLAAFLRDFLHDEAVGGVLLLLAAVIALIWANSPAAVSYQDFWHHELTVGYGQWAIHEELIGWINDGVMAVFFFVVGLEIKRELVIGELRSPGAAAMPAVAAIGGVALPALLFLLIAPSGDAGRGWGVPMATDIAFAVGVLALVGRSASGGAKLSLLSIAIVDDLIAIVVIAVFYSAHISWGWAGIAAAGLAIVVAMRRRVSSPWAYILPAAVVWVGLLESGIHATIAGVLLGLLTPARPVRGRAVLEDLEHRLHPISAFVIVPLFALANAGVYLRGGALGDALGQRLTWAVAAAMVVGKTLGIAGGTLVMLRSRVGSLPMDMPPREVWPVAALGGIGFTVAMFIADLAYSDQSLINNAKVGIFTGSLVAALLGSFLLRLVGRGAKVPTE